MRGVVWRVGLWLLGMGLGVALALDLIGVLFG